MMNPTSSREMPSCSAIDLAEIRPAVFQDKLVNLINNFQGGYCFESSTQGASQVEKSPGLNWVNQFLAMAYDVACSSYVSVKMT
jgi:hypothetical protein